MGFFRTWNRGEKRAYQEAVTRGSERPATDTREIPKNQQCLFGRPHDFSMGGRCWHCCKRREDITHES